MNRNTAKYIVDVGMGISFLFVFLTGLMKWPTKAYGRMKPTYEMKLIHDYSGIILGLLVCVHLILNGRWILAMTKNIYHKK